MNPAGMQADISLRTATAADASALAAIYAPYVTDTTVTFEYEAPDAAEFARRIADFSAMYPYLVAAVDGRIVGYAYAHRYAARKAYDWSAETSVYVDCAYRGRGVGRALYCALLALVSMQRIQTAYAIIALPNPASVSFHTALGFTLVGTNRQIGFKLGKWLDTATYALPLNEHAVPPAPVIPFPALPADAVSAALARVNPRA